MNLLNAIQVMYEKYSNMWLTQGLKKDEREVKTKVNVTKTTTTGYNLSPSYSVDAKIPGVAEVSYEGQLGNATKTKTVTEEYTCIKITCPKGGNINCTPQSCD